MCTGIDPKGTGHLLSDVRLRRRIQEAARGRERREEEQRLLAGMREGNHVPGLATTTRCRCRPLPSCTHERFRILWDPEGHDLLQVFWCPFEVHGDGRTIDVVLAWRRSADVRAVLTPQPEPPVAGRAECVPTLCAVHPEQVVEHAYLGLLDEELQEEIDAWEEGLLDEEEEEGEEGEQDGSASAGGHATYEEYAAATAVARAAEPEETDYMSDLSIAPGWKAGGFASWHLTDPAPVDCQVCGAAMPPLLTVDKWECDGASRSWLPAEDRGGGGDNDPRVLDRSVSTSAAA